MVQQAVDELMQALARVPGPEDDSHWRAKADILCTFGRQVSAAIVRAAGLGVETEEGVWNCLTAHFEIDSADLRFKVFGDRVDNSNGEALHLYYVRPDLTTSEAESAIETTLIFCRGRIINWDERRDRIRRVMSYEEAAQSLVFWMMEKLMHIIQRNNWHRMQGAVNIYDRMLQFVLELEQNPPK
jgi:hypothetical protein